MRARGFLGPVTVAGPHRSFTGLPLTTDRMYGASLSLHPGVGAVAARRRRPPSILNSTSPEQRWPPRGRASSS